MLNVGALHLYHGASHTLRGVNIDARPGEVSCLLGRNGVGKTSLLRAVLGLNPISRGFIRLGEEEIHAWRTEQRVRAGIALVPQGREIFPRLSVEENLRAGFSALARGQRAIPAEVFELFPVLAEMKRRRGGDLSGGQQQQLAIARALVLRPKVLLLDEPTEGIQPSIIKRIGEVIRYLAKERGLAVLLVEQYLDFAQEVADRVHVMERGEIVLGGARDDLDPETVRRYLTV